MPLILLNKPFGMVSRFLDDSGRPGLGRLIERAGVYPAGRLDADSEGLLLLTDDGALQARISHPRHKLPKTYLVQVEGTVSAAELAKLCAGVALRDGPARALAAQAVPPPSLWPRQPPVRERRQIPDSWLELVIAEGRNRQVRRMTAAVGLPTLRLVRTRVGPWALEGLAPGEWRELSLAQSWAMLGSAAGIRSRRAARPGQQASRTGRASGPRR
ncbi:MAG: pseudouridine synthase [Gammaproteobacteria bacterium]|nr:pseudouridine synthase [Gammaproteobacteria bacterium]